MIKKNEIENIASEVLASLGIKEAPIPVDKIAELLGITIENQDLDDTTSGFLVRRNEKTIIGINQSHPPVRIRFTIAHELGHYKLHADRALFVDYYKGSKIMRSEEQYSPQEKEANQFAAFLLMPKKIINEEMKFLSESLEFNDIVSKLSKTFAVSQQAMDYRLKALGLYDYGF